MLGREDERAVDDNDSRLSRAAQFAGVADVLRGLVAQNRYDLSRRDQLSALADGIERFADRLEQEAQVPD